MLEGGHVTRTRWTHHVTAASLSGLQRAAYQQYLDMHLADDALPTSREWCKNTVRRSLTVPVLEYDNLTRVPGHAVRDIYERRQLPAVCTDAQKVGPVVLCHGTYALLEVGASPYQRHDPAERHTPKCLPHKVTSRCKRQDTPSHQWHWIKTTNS